MENEKQSGTRERILKAARRIFLERGYAKATIRDICSLAEANVAAVHYHFNDKTGVYEAVLDDLLSSAMQRYPMDMGLSEDPSARERLYAFINSFMHRLLLSDDAGDLADRSRLLSEALVTRSPILERILKNHVQPLLDELEDILVELMSGAVPHKVLMACCAGVIGQCLHYFYSRLIVEKLETGLFEGPQDVEFIVNHLFHFSLGGLQAVLEQCRNESRGNGAKDW